MKQLEYYPWQQCTVAWKCIWCVFELEFKVKLVPYDILRGKKESLSIIIMYMFAPNHSTAIYQDLLTANLHLVHFSIFYTKAYRRGNKSEQCITQKDFIQNVNA